MAWFRRNKNGDDYNAYGGTGYSDHVHHPVILDSDGRKHPVAGYTATHNSSQSYVAKTERVVRYQNVPGFPAMRDQKYSPPRKEAYKDHRDGDNPHLVPRISTHDRPEKTSEFSPKARDHEVVHRQNKNFPWNNGYRDNSPPSNDQYRTGHRDYGKHDNFNSKTNNKYHDYDEEDEEEDDVICNDGVCFENPRKGSKPNYFKDENYNNENEKHKGNGYNPPTYTVPISTHQPKRDPYYKTPHINTAINNNNNSDQKEKGNNNYSPRKFSAITTQPRPRDQDNQETIDSTEARRRYSNPMQGSGTGSGYDEQKYTRTIDSNEAARLYGGVLLPNENKIMQMHT